jgi:hypothetical protein
LYFVESDSDYELDKWNEADEKKQEEGDDGDDIQKEDNSVTKKNDFIDEEADEDDDSRGGFDDINSGSDGDVSDEGNSDDNDDNSVFSDDEKVKHKKRHKLKKYKKSKEKTQEDIRNHEEGTLDLFNFNSNSQTGSDDSKNCNPVAGIPKDSEETGPGLCLRLDSIEEDEEISQNSTEKKEFKSPISTRPLSTMEESSQSSLSFQTASDPEGTNESSRIQPAQGGGRNRPIASDSDRETPELLSMFPRILKHITGNKKTSETQNKKVKLLFCKYTTVLLFYLHVAG